MVFETIASTIPPLRHTSAIVESHEGRPTHIEGNDNHPQSKGSVNSFVQASILDLYEATLNLLAYVSFAYLQK